ncbi:hypothetical protein DSO57_1022301 [Entomophthora muscae]|uniref:Uncharacterized protein n=1 Tax=Entomophthora muscae TaxID=34485 RepID=A0ACC2SG49_9FUNG|nr:hypothetical protein DSO57_1022301 [Entomophthora muscae]
MFGTPKSCEWCGENNLKAFQPHPLMIFAPEQTMHFDAPWFPHMQFWNPPSQSCPQPTPHLQQCTELEPGMLFHLRFQ